MDRPAACSPQSPIAFVIAAYRAYTSLLAAGGNNAHDLGGQLLYAGELDDRVRALVAAANIAGAATLTAFADQAVLRRAAREGIVDFLVNSLDEALRILKNELRKRQPVAVAVSLAPSAVEAEMIERGVLPDLLPESPAGQPTSEAVATFVAQGAHRIGAAPTARGKRLRIWSTPAEFAQTPAAFEALLLDHISPDDEPARRWLHLSPRYLGHAARRLRSLPCDDRTAEWLTARLGSPEWVAEDAEG